MKAEKFTPPSPDSTIIIQRCSFSRIDSPIGCSLRFFKLFQNSEDMENRKIELMV
jgi:hypothetical protein